MIDFRDIMQRVKEEADRRSHEVWMHTLDLYRKERFKGSHFHYDHRRYVALKLTMHRIKRSRDSDWVYVQRESGMLHEDERHFHLLISDYSREIDKIKHARKIEETRWTSYLP